MLLMRVTEKFQEEWKPLDSKLEKILVLEPECRMNRRARLDAMGSVKKILN